MWNGFIRGFYHEHRRDMISSECFGEWIEDDLEHIDDALDRVLDFEPITYEEAQKIGLEVVDLVYKNIEECKFGQWMQDVERYCESTDDFCGDATVFNALFKNMIPMGAKMTEIFEAMFFVDPFSDEEFYQASDMLGNSCGALFSYMLDFNEKWEK